MNHINNNSIHRITALWAFNEAALGGILHALHVPFSGIVLGGFAAIFIYLIAYDSPNRLNILKALTIVLAVKFAVSPHTPFGAYVSVTFQGLTGFLIFSLLKTNLFSSLLFSILVMLISSFQKIIVYLILFGFQLVDSINLFVSIAIEKIPFLNNLPKEINYAFLIIGSYLSIYIFAGIALGMLIYRIPYWLENVDNDDPNIKLNSKKLEINTSTINLQKKKRKKRALIYIFISIAILLLVASYIFPEHGNIDSSNLLFMIIRVLLIITIWYLVLLPLITKLLQRLLKKSKMKYASDVDEIIESLPIIKYEFLQIWDLSRNKGVTKRLKYFLTYFLRNIIVKKSV